MGIPTADSIKTRVDSWPRQRLTPTVGICRTVVIVGVTRFALQSCPDRVRGAHDSGRFQVVTGAAPPAKTGPHYLLQRPLQVHSGGSGREIQYTFAATGRSVSFTEVMAEPGSAQPGSAQTGRDAQPGAMLNRA